MTTMDVSEKLVKQAISHFLYGVSHDIFSEPVTTYAKLAIEALKKKTGATVQEWISVEDRLPEIGRCVIAYNALAKCAAEAMYKGEGMFLQFRWPARLQEHEITHWMPMPQPPKGE